MTEPPVDLHFVVPAGIDDQTRPSGGNRYDRRVIDELTVLGRVLHEHRVADLDGVLSVLSELPDGAAVVVDGLLVCSTPEGDLLDVKQDAVVAACERLRVVVLLHMPFAEALPDESVRRGEQAVLSAAAGVVTTSAWSCSWVVRHHGIAPERVHVATPGADPAPAWSRDGRSATSSTSDGGRLLCLGAVTLAKGHDILLTALAEIADLDWQSTVAGALDLEPDYVVGLHEVALRSGIADRVVFAGPLPEDALLAALGDADLLVSTSRRESYGMAVTEALAHAVPVVITDVGGHAEALGLLDDGTRAGVLVPPDDPDRMAATLRRWLEDPAERDRLRSAAAQRRETLGSWTDTARRLADAIDSALNRGDDRSVFPDTTSAP